MARAPGERSQEAPVEADAASAGASPSLSQQGSAPLTALERLDLYRAAERSGAETLEAWASKTSDEELRGVLLAVAARERAHAELLEGRLRDLGRAPRAGVPAWLARYNEELLDERASDRDRLASIVVRLADLDDALEPLERDIESGAFDATTRAILRAIAADERQSLGELRRALTERA